MSGIKFVPVSELNDYVGQTFGPTEWLTVDQDRINRFADATEDHQFIHVDEEKARQTPFGGTIAHGFLTLSLCPFLLGQANVAPEGIRMAVNYGLDRLRFLNPVPSGGRIRGIVKPLSFEEKAPGQILSRVEITVEVDGSDKPALIAEQLSMYFL